jgi:hypothetical protein
VCACACARMRVCGVGVGCTNHLDIAGAAGGYAAGDIRKRGGYGAIARGTFEVSKGDSWSVVVGQVGTSG